MCLMVYLGADRAIAGFSEMPIGGIGLDPDVPNRPAALGGKRHVWQVADRVPTGWNCSCIFLDHVLPWKAEEGDDPEDPETPARAAAYAGLADIARAALAVDAAPLFFSCWAGGETGTPVIERNLTPDDLRPARYLFDDTLDGGEGANPPILIRLQLGAGA